MGELSNLNTLPAFADGDLTLVRDVSDATDKDKVAPWSLHKSTLKTYFDTLYAAQTTGSWTMGLTFGGAAAGMTVTANPARYTRTGNKVTAWGRLVLSNKGTSTGNATITGLPFASVNIADFFQPVTFRPQNMTYTGVLDGAVLNNATAITLYINNGGAAIVANDTHFTNTSNIAIEVTYMVA